MTKTNNQKTGDWEEIFDDNFSYLDKVYLNPIKQFISNLLQEQKQSLLKKKGETKRIWFMKGVESAKQRYSPMDELNKIYDREGK